MNFFPIWLHHKIWQKNPLILELSLKSSCLHPIFGPLFTPYALFEWGPHTFPDVLMSIRTAIVVCWSHYGFDWNQILYWLTVSPESFQLEMGAGISFMSADVATLMSRLLLLFIFITIAACGLHLHMRKLITDDGVLLNAKPVPWEQSKLAFVAGLILNLT